MDQILSAPAPGTTSGPGFEKCKGLGVAPQRRTPTPQSAHGTGIITLRGSTETVVEFFGYAISSILYQRGVYPAEHFGPVSKYGLSILVTKEESLNKFIGEVLQQLRGWMLSSQVKKLIVVIASQATGQTLERWTFDIQVSEEVADDCALPHTQADKVLEQKQIQAIIRQISASVTWLPLLDEPCSFDLLVYTDKAADVPEAWGESDPKYIVGGSQEVKLRSFTTKIHQVDGSVVYGTTNWELSAQMHAMIGSLCATRISCLAALSRYSF
eukprot:CAMPEP_0183443330 /NCGR_PEP_ID=MMETSP0370-20130417/91390_1 /TAXON_ID=268820 /ORGANISM="Peridinium aciculiferum, Strain PAER-2" /LENGTH=269 /DNA_ID=CAMNT_0025633287 /DNA_START=77 /DNA_END=884 /DNA_ORIENTATION=-